MNLFKSINLKDPKSIQKWQPTSSKRRGGFLKDLPNLTVSKISVAAHFPMNHQLMSSLLNAFVCTYSNNSTVMLKLLMPVPCSYFSPDFKKNQKLPQAQFSKIVCGGERRCLLRKDTKKKKRICFFKRNNIQNL